MNYWSKLKRLIDDIDEMLEEPYIMEDAREFQQWQIRAEHLLSRCYGSQSVEMKRFQKVKFSTTYEDRTPAQDVQQCKNGLHEVKDILEIYLKELEDENLAKAMNSINERLKYSRLSMMNGERKPVVRDSDMKKKYQVFISSTYEDLKEERAAVTQCLLNNNCIPVGMEQFPASNMSQMEYIKKMLDDCDYYILIIGGRYGSLDDDGVGYTEKEYNYALQKGIPVMAFINAHPEKLSYDKCEQTDIGREKFKTFCDRVWKNRKLVKGYENIGDLKSHVGDAINFAMREYPGVGWVRGDSVSIAVDDSSARELEELHAKIEELASNTPKITFGKEDPPQNLKEGEIYFQYE